MHQAAEGAGGQQGEGFWGGRVKGDGLGRRRVHDAGGVELVENRVPLRYGVVGKCRGGAAGGDGLRLNREGAADTQEWGPSGETKPRRREANTPPD